MTGKFPSVVCLLLFLYAFPTLTSAEVMTEEAGFSSIVLVPHGEDPVNSKDRIVIPMVKDGLQPPLPCIVAESGDHAQTYEHGQTFTKGSFHYKCRNGTAEVIACVADDAAVIQISRTFLRNGIRHKCNVDGETESTCFENGVHYDIGESFRNGSFRLVCREGGVAVQGCYVQNSTSEVITLGESRILQDQKHSCEVVEGGKIRYIINFLGCRRGDEVYKEGQIWTDRHVRYQCNYDGTTKVLACMFPNKDFTLECIGCMDDGGLFVDLGRDMLVSGIVHRCYKTSTTTFYHRFACDEGKSLSECVSDTSTPKRLARSPRDRLQLLHAYFH